MLTFHDLPESAINKITTYRFDRIVEKHEGPEHWQSMVEYYDLEFFEIDAKAVLLPVDREHHKNITILRSIVDKNETTLTVFLKDTTHVDNSDYEYFEAGFIAICDKVPDEDFFITTVYHEWFIIERTNILTS